MERATRTAASVLSALHILREVLELLQPGNPARQLRVYVDGTLGSGGHASMIMQAHKVSRWSCKLTQGEQMVMQAHRR